MEKNFFIYLILNLRSQLLSICFQYRKCVEIIWYSTHEIDIIQFIVLQIFMLQIDYIDE